MPELLKQGKKLSPKEVVQHCSENNIPSIAYTYTEPTVYFEYAFDTMKLAHKAGIKENDIVLEINGFKLTEKKELADIIQTLKVGDECEMTVMRGNDTLKVKTILEERK